MTQETIYIRPVVKQGKRGRFRVHLQDEDGNHIAVFPIRGFETRDEAWEAAHRLSKARWTFGYGFRAQSGPVESMETDEDEQGFLADVKDWLGGITGRE